MSYQLYRTESIVLSSNPCGEADKVMLFFTREFGLVRVYAKGVRLEKSKLRGHLDVLCKTQIGFVAGKELKRLTHASLVSVFPRIQRNIFRFRGAVAAAAFLRKGIVEDEPDKMLWEMFQQALSVFDSADVLEKDIPLILSAFRIKLFSLWGYLPQKRPQAAEALFRSPTLLPRIPFSESSRTELRLFLNSIQVYVGDRIRAGDPFLFW